MNSPSPVSTVRTFSSGATRNLDTGKLDYEGFLSPLVLEAFARYMNKHRKQADGKLRDSDNWQKGMGKSVYMKSLWRHFMDLWQLHRGHQPVSPETGEPIDIETAIAACLFNLQGYLHEHLQPGKYGSLVPPELVPALNAIKDSLNASSEKTKQAAEPTIGEQAAQCVKETFEAVDRMFVAPTRSTNCLTCGRRKFNAESKCPICDKPTTGQTIYNTIEQQHVFPSDH